MTNKLKFTVFTKPWPSLTVPELGKFIAGLGFDGIELPIRPGYPVEMANVAEGLPQAARTLADFNLEITNVAATPSEELLEACAEAKVPMIRLQYNVGKESYLEVEKKVRGDLEKMVPLCRQYGVKIGIQNHGMRFLPANSNGIRALIGDFDPACVAAVWDACHAAMSGEEPEMGLDIVWSHLCMVNLKNFYYRRTTGTEASDVEWGYHWTTARQGLASWPRVAQYLKQRDYAGPICLSAQYTAEDQVDRLIAEDLAYAKALFAAAE